MAFEVEDLKALCEAYTKAAADLATAKQGLENIRDHYRLKNLECKYCGEASAVAQQTLDELSEGK